MEIFYKAYTKTQQNQLYYFVKRFRRFPELGDISDILDGYGMHTDFNKACAIAGIADQKVRAQILSDMEGQQHQAKVIDLVPQEENAITKVAT